MTDICAVLAGFALEIAATAGDDAARPVAAGSNSGAAKTIRKNLGRRAGAMAEPAMLSPKPASMPDFGGRPVLRGIGLRLQTLHKNREECGSHFGRGVECANVGNFSETSGVTIPPPHFP